MSSIFISHSSENDDWAIALRDWLVAEGWSGENDIFLDVDPERGIAAGQRWQQSFADAATRCEAVVFLISKQWLNSRWCHDEFQISNKYNKKLFALLIDESSLEDLPGGLTTQWQVVQLTGEPAERFVAVHPYSQKQWPVHMAKAGLARLKDGLKKAGIGPENFDLEKDSDGPFGWRSPYRGLQALDVEDAAVFFGRNADIIRGMDALRGTIGRAAPQAAVILGASGSGKSSLLRAGLWPRLLRDDAQWLPFKAVRAGRTGAIEGEEGLLGSLQEVHRRFGMRASRSELRTQLRTTDDFVNLLRNLRREAGKRAMCAEGEVPIPVLCLDQCEEFFARDAGEESEKLLELAQAGSLAGELLILATIRSDSYGQMQSSKLFAGIEQVPISLGPVPLGEVASIIREPAELLRRKVGPDAPVFEAAAIEMLQVEIEGEPDALPLLAFVLQRLMREHTGESTIGVEQIKQSGGLSQAIEVEAGAAFKDAGYSESQQERREVLRHLFVPQLARINRESMEAQRHVASQVEISEDALQLAHALTERRLLVVRAGMQSQVDDASADSDDTSDGGFARQESTIEVAHEALLRHWEMLDGILGEDRGALLLLDNVLMAEADWKNAEDSRKPDFLVHSGSRLVNAKALAGRGQSWAREIAPAEAYLEACEDREKTEKRSKRRWRRMVLGLLIVFFVSGLGVIYADQLQLARYKYFSVRPFVKSGAEEEKLLSGATQFRECADCPDMVFIRPGTFVRGGPKSGSPDIRRETPFGEVEIRNAFAVSVTEISFSQWDFCATQGVCRANVASGQWGRGEQPVINVTWDDAQSYVDWVSDLTGKRYRLLSEVEWEFGARGGTNTNYSFVPEHRISEFGWFARNSDNRPHEVGKLMTNPYGLKDMHGNVAEWVEDCFHERYVGAPTTELAWTDGPNCDRRVVRGGHWLSDAKALRSASRDWHPKNDDSSDLVGFRIARDIDGDR